MRLSSQAYFAVASSLGSDQVRKSSLAETHMLGPGVPYFGPTYWSGRRRTTYRPLIHSGNRITSRSSMSAGVIHEWNVQVRRSSETARPERVMLSGRPPVTLPEPGLDGSKPGRWRPGKSVSCECGTPTPVGWLLHAYGR